MMNFEKLLETENNEVYLCWEIMEDKVKNIDNAISGLEIIKEAVTVNSNMYHFNRLISKIDSMLDINFYDNFASDFNYLIALKDFERLYEKQKNQKLSDAEKRINYLINNLISKIIIKTI
jgi:hypothetical protein